MAEGVKIPLHFPCADRVKMPQIGCEDSDITISKLNMQLNSDFKMKRVSSFDQSEKSIHTVGKSYIRDICGDLSFSEDVVRDRCIHMLPYDDKYFWEAMDVSQLIPMKPKKIVIVGRHNTSGSDKRHMPCISAKPHSLKPLKKKTTQKALKMHQAASICMKVELQSSPDSLENTEDCHENNVFLTEIDEKQPKEKADLKICDTERETTCVKTEPNKEKKHNWGAYLMSIISPLTANWIVHQRMTGGGASDKEDLSELLEGWYGKPEHTDLIRDDVSETDLHQSKTPTVEKQRKKKWKKDEAVLLEKVFKTGQEPKACDPYSDDNEAPFYRQPTGFRKQRKKIEKEEMGAINSTAREIQVKTYEPPPPPTLRDFFNPNVGDKLIQTDNMFEREWLTGNEQIYQGEGEEIEIVMSSQNKYRKQLQKEYPGASNTWFPETEKNDVDSPRFSRPTKGSRRWKALPEPVDDTVDILKCLPPGTEPPVVVPSDAKTKKIKQQNPALSQIIDEWRSKWQLSGQFADSNPQDLLRDMADIQPHIRLKAIATVAKAVEYKPPDEDGIQLEYQEQQNDVVGRLPEFIFEALNCLLEDKHDQVKKAAAVTLYSLNKPSDKAEKILRDLLFNDSLTDRWAAAQCLAHFGVCDSDVAGEVIRQLLATEDAIKHEQSIQLLAKMSTSTTLIHSMVAEQLNSSSWRHRVIACKIFPTLDGTINKDICNKLSYLMWKDWHVEVRKAAAQALGKTGHGRNVHDDLREKIQGSDERLKLEAISRVGQLGIMTAKLLPVILDCFDDEYISVRMEACITCGNLMIKDDQVIKKLLYCATFDSAWKVKALAIQALGKICISTSQIVDSLMWALRYEEEAGVRAEACHSLLLLDYKGDDLIEILQERLLVEDSEVVKQEMSTALQFLGFSSSEDIDTVVQIKNEVRKLCDQGIISSQILSNDRNEEKRQTLSRMIYTAQKELDRFFSRTNTYLKMNLKSDVERSSENDYNEQQDEVQINKSLVSDESLTWNVITASDSQDRSLEGKQTATVDKEVEAILSRHKVDRQSPSPESRASSRSSGTEDDESRPLTSVSIRSRMDRIPEESVKTEFDDSKSEIDIKSELDTYSQFDTKSETDVKSFVASEDKSRQPIRENMTGTVGKSQLPQDGRRSDEIWNSNGEKRETDTFSDQPLSVKIDLNKQPLTPTYGEMRSSSMSMGGSASRRQIISRETLREREKINAEARKSLLKLNARYSSMIERLKKVDEGFCADETLHETTAQETEKLISNISI